MPQAYTPAPAVAKPVRCSQRDTLRELRRFLSRYWLRLRPGCRQRTLCRGLVDEVDRMLAAPRWEAGE